MINPLLQDIAKAYQLSEASEAVAYCEAEWSKREEREEENTPGYSDLNTKHWLSRFKERNRAILREFSAVQSQNISNILPLCYGGRFMHILVTVYEVPLHKAGKKFHTGHMSYLGVLCGGPFTSDVRAINIAIRLLHYGNLSNGPFLHRIKRFFKY